MYKTTRLRAPARAEDLPVHPSIARRIRQMEARADVCEDDLLRLIGADPSLAARAMRLANAPIFGRPGKISTLSHALSVIGPDQGRALMGGIVHRQGSASGETWSSFWVHAIHSASIANHLAERLSYELPEEAYVAGLLHDIGKGYMGLMNPDGASQIWGSIESQAGAARRERDLFGVTHTELGARLARKWGLGSAILSAMRFHHAPPARIRKLAARERTLVGIVGAADHLAHARRQGERSAPRPYAGFDPAEALNIRTSTLRSACDEAERTLLESARAIGFSVASIAELYRDAARTFNRDSIARATARETESLPSLTDVLHQLRSKTSFAQVVEASLEALRSQLGFDRALYLEKARTGRTFRVIRIVDGARHRTRAPLRISADPDDTAIARCIETRRALLASDGRKDGSLLDHFGTHEMGLAPVVSRGQVVGFFAVDKFARGTPISDREVALLELLAGEAGLLLDNYTLQSQGRILKEFAEKDEITGISNRRHAIEHGRKEVERAKRYGTPLSLVMLDLDDFKELNDRYGHLAGDRVLSEVARILASNSRRTDVLGRYGGDEFLALLPEIGREQATAYAERMRAKVEEFSKRLQPEYPQVSLSISVGVSTLQPGAKLEDLIESADRALYAAKEAGKNRVCLNG